jgi:hypothetical protein
MRWVVHQQAEHPWMDWMPRLQILEVQQILVLNQEQSLQLMQLSRRPHPRLYK